jgi:hypothetical protein
MTDVREVESNNQIAELRQAEPQRHLAPQHAELGTAALAGDHQHIPGVVRLCLTQKARQGDMRLCLSHAVQIDAPINRVAATRQTPSSAEINGSETRRWGR